MRNEHMDGEFVGYFLIDVVESGYGICHLVVLVVVLLGRLFLPWDNLGFR
jgi:hypothetical protein